jgi:poly-gamma-glutamate capsule biosynthesis protein CapA/YwtB (metallophosphatase superfamily)
MDLMWNRPLLIGLLVLAGGALFQAVPVLPLEANRPKAVDAIFPDTSSVVTPDPQVAPSALPIPQESGSEEVGLIFGGDVMLGRTVEQRMTQYGPEWPLAQIASTLNNEDIAVVNLESPFRTDAKRTEINSLILRGYPQGVATLAVAGIDVVSLANNHITDMGKTGLEETFSLLNKNNIAYTGAGTSPAEAAVPAIIARRGQRIGFLSYTYGVNFSSPGVHFQGARVELMREQVASLREEVDAVVVLCHCGPEYAPSPTSTQKEFARAAIDAGAALVVGHHPHVPQPVEEYKSGLILYSLGNLVFDQLPGGNRDRSALARITLKKGVPTRMELLPYQIYSLSQPRLITDQARKEAVWQLFNVPKGVWEKPV